MADRTDGLYRAEEISLFPCRQFLSVDDAQGYINEILASRWWQGRCPIAEVRLSYAVKKRFSQSWIKDGLGYVDITRGFLNEAWVLHEMAHLMAPKTGHGPLFFKAYFALVRWKMGSWHLDRLRKALQSEGVEI